MPFQTIRGTRLHYKETGTGTETVVFSHGLLMNGNMFRGQVDNLCAEYRCITYDHRGQGGSEVTKSGYDMASLTQDAAALIRELGAAPCHFVGLSMGGFVGLRLAIRHPELLKSLILVETSADPEPDASRGPYRRMALVGRWFGFRPLANRVMKIMFGQTFLTDPGRQAEREYWRRQLLGLNRVGTARAAHAVIDRNGVYDQLDRIVTPTLILVGDEDVATVPAKAERMQAGIVRSKLVTVPGAGHSSSIEQPGLVTTAIREFLAAL